MQDGGIVPARLKVELSEDGFDIGVAPPKPAPLQRAMAGLATACDTPPVPRAAMRYAVKPRRKPQQVAQPRGGVVQIRAVTAQVVKFARRFPVTHWEIEEIADLFGVAGDDLAQALVGGAA